MSFTLVRNAARSRERRRHAGLPERCPCRTGRSPFIGSAADDRGLEDLLERLRTRFYGKYGGIVTDVDASTMRIKAVVPSVLGETDTGWCMPCVPYAGPNVGFAFLPEQGSGYGRVRGRGCLLSDLGRGLLEGWRVPDRRGG